MDTKLGTVAAMLISLLSAGAEAQATKQPPPQVACNNASASSIGGADFRCKAESRLDKHQFAYTWISMKGDGTGSVMSKYSNGKKLDGDNFQTYVFFLSKEGEPVIVLKQAAGVNASGGGKAVERNVRNSIKISPEAWSTVEKVSVKHTKMGRCDDAKIWNNIGGTVVKVLVTAPEPTKVATEVAKTTAIQLASCKKK